MLIPDPNAWHASFLLWGSRPTAEIGFPVRDASPGKTLLLCSLAFALICKRGENCNSNGWYRHLKERISKKWRRMKRETAASHTEYRHQEEHADLLSL